MDEERLGLLAAAKMRRVLGQLRRKDQVSLDEDEIHHLTRVLRLGEGAIFEAIVPPATRCRCRLTREGGTWVGTVLGQSDVTWEAPLRICLVQALIKKEKFEWVVQKAVELGVAEIQPALTHRTEVHLTDRRRDNKLARWTKILREAVKQCGRTDLPQLHEPRPLPEILTERHDVLRLVLDEEGDRRLEDSLSSSGSVDSCALFIGPEGGWDEIDREAFRRCQIAAVRLGPRILRTETAAIAALSILQYRLGDLADSPERFCVDYHPPTQ